MPKVTKFQIQFKNKESGDVTFGNVSDNKDFKVPDENGATNLYDAWRNECNKLNRKYPDHYLRINIIDFTDDK